jgi:ubiquinone/menaquinone biosynthesis C-methylase UbiE
MKASSSEEVRKMYESTADAYAEMMDSEIALPLYADVLGRLRSRIAATPGVLVDTSCGSGHMLFLYHEKYDRDRPLVGVDLSPRMVAIARERLGSSADIVVGDMRSLDALEDDSAAAVVSFFAVHHLDPEGFRAALREWSRVLRHGGQLLLAAWEGVGAIDYGEAAEIVALRYRSGDITAWAEGSGFATTRCAVEPVEEMGMDAVYLEGVKQ